MDTSASSFYVLERVKKCAPFRYDHISDLYHHDLEGNGVICSAVDILPTEFAKEVNGTFLFSGYLFH